MRFLASSGEVLLQVLTGAFGTFFFLSPRWIASKNLGWQGGIKWETFDDDELQDAVGSLD